MKKQIYFILIAMSGLIGFAGCSRERIYSVADEITVQASIGNRTKVSYEGNTSSFTSGDCFILYGWTGSASAIPDERVVDGVVNTFDGSKWTPETKMVWKNMTGKHYFMGISPVPANADSFTDIPYTMNPDDYTASDILVATRLDGVTGMNGPVKLQFDHVMAKLVVNLHFLSEWDAVPEVTSVTTVARTEATVDYFTKAVTVKGEASDLAIPAAVTSQHTGNIVPFESIMVPQEGVRSITVVIDGREFYFESAKDFPLKANKYTALELAVGKEKMELTDVSVNEWDSGTSLHGGDARVDADPEFIISVPVEDALFRNLSNTCVIPFADVPGQESEMLSGIVHPDSFSGLASLSDVNCKISYNHSMPAGAKNVLFYAKEPNYPGDLNVTGLSDEEFTKPGGIAFSPKPITSETQDGNVVGSNIVKLLTDLASDLGTSNNKVLSLLYERLITTTVSSSYNLSVFLNQIYFDLEDASSLDFWLINSDNNSLINKLRDDILNACIDGYTPVENTPLQLKSDYAGYPGNIGLPEGAARIKWNNGRFVETAAGYGLGLEAGLADYVYPSGLWYYANSALKASDLSEIRRFNGAGSWAEVINGIYADDVVGNKTVSVALKEPVQYAVGCLDVKIQMGADTFYDGKGNAVSTGAGYTLKGVLVSGQNSTSYDFSRKGNENKVTYSNTVPGGIVAVPDKTTDAVRTMVMETPEAPVVVLEFVNGGDAFVGADGVIPAGGTFYLPVKMDKPVKKGEITTLTFTIENGKANPTSPVGLGAAVNGIPYLSPTETVIWDNSQDMGSSFKIPAEAYEEVAPNVILFFYFSHIGENAYFNFCASGTGYVHEWAVYEVEDGSIITRGGIILSEELYKEIVSSSSLDVWSNNCIVEKITIKKY